MQRHLFDHIDIDPKNIHIPNGELPKEKVKEHCTEYEQAIEQAGGIDLQVLGIGNNGHIGFNEPGSSIYSRTRLITLENSTRLANSYEFANISEVPRMPGLDPKTGQVVSSHFEEQVRQSFENIRIVLEDAGSNLTKVVKTTIFMVTGNDFAVINKIYKEFFPENPPARSTPQVMPFPAGILVSIECIAQL